MKIRSFAEDTQAKMAGRRLKDVGGVSFGRILEDALSGVKESEPPLQASIEQPHVFVKRDGGGHICAVDFSV